MSTIDLDLRNGEQRLGPYRLIRPISAGGMARVYEGRLDSLAGVSTRVAVKVIHPDFASDRSFRDLFISEAQISAFLEHPNLVRVQQFNQEGALLYLVMEYIEGFTLRKLLSYARKQGVGITTSIIAEIGRQVCDGLQYAHTLRDAEGRPLHLVHRDIKPSNLMVNLQGTVKLLDFGISSAQGLAQNDGVKGTWGYMALEQANGQAVGGAADLFGLGAVLYELATGDALFPERDNEAIRKLLASDEPARRAAAFARPELAGLLIRMLQRDPAARHNSAAELGRALGALVGDPLPAQEALRHLALEIRASEGSVQAGAAAGVRSFSTIGGKADGAGLPVGTGDAHGPRITRPSATKRPVVAPVLGLTFVALFAVGALAIMGFAAWQLWRSTAPRPAPSTVDLSALAEPISPPPSRTVAEPGKPAPTRVVSPPPPEPAAPVRIAPVTPPEPIPAPKPSVNPTPAALETPRAVAPATAKLSVGADVVAQVLINGSFVRNTPLQAYELPEGSHTIKLIPESGEPKTFKVTLNAGQSVVKIWNFEEEHFVDEQ